MSWVKQATQMQAGLSKPSAKAKPADSPLKDSLKDDLHVQPKLEPAAKPAQAEGVSSLVEKAKDAVIDQGGTDVKSHDALVKTVQKFAGSAAADAASAELMEQVKSTDKRVARSFADTVAGDGGGAMMAPVVLNRRQGGREDEEEDEDEDVPETSATESTTTDG